MKKTIIALTTLAIASSSFAADTQEETKELKPLRLGIGYANVTVPNSGVNPTGFVLQAGYDLSDVVGASFSYTDASGGEGTLSVDASSLSFDLDIGNTFTMSNGVPIKVYGLAGFSLLDMEATATACGAFSCSTASASSSDNFYRLGFGARAYFNDFGLEAQYVNNYWTEDTSIDYSQVNVIASYRF